MRDVVVSGVNAVGLAMHVTIGPHVLRGDEPVEAGGTDTGPQPHELLLAALGTCTAMTLRLYASRKGWALKDVQVRVTGGTEAGAYRIREVIAIDGPLDAQQRARLLEIATRCPVHRTLTGAVIIDTEEGELT